MLQEQNDIYYSPYSIQQYSPLPGTEEASDGYYNTQVLSEKDSSQPFSYHLESPVAALPPHKPRRHVRTSIIITLLLATIFAVGLFAAGWEFAANNRTTTNTLSNTVTSSIVPQSGVSNIETQQEAAIAKIEPAVVELVVTTTQGKQIGSAVIIDTNGDIVTNNHVISGAQTIKAVLYNGVTETAQLVGGNAANDLAVVRIAPFSHMTVAQIANSSKLTVGQEVLAIGNPLGITETATRGIVSALNRSVTEPTGATISQVIQTDASINPGNSGGALVDLQGNLIGIPTLTAVNTQSGTPANGVGFAIPSNLVMTVVQQIIGK